MLEPAPASPKPPSGPTKAPGARGAPFRPAADSSTKNPRAARGERARPTARALGRASASCRDVDAFVQSLLRGVDARLAAARRLWGLNSVRCDLPSYFPVPGMPAEMARTLVYSAVLAALEKRGFTVALEPAGSVTALVVVWCTRVSAKELRRLRAFVADHTLPQVLKNPAGGGGGGGEEGGSATDGAPPPVGGFWVGASESSESSESSEKQKQKQKQGRRPAAEKATPPW